MIVKLPNGKIEEQAGERKKRKKEEKKNAIRGTPPNLYLCLNIIDLVRPNERQGGEEGKGKGASRQPRGEIKRVLSHLFWGVFFKKNPPLR